MNGNKYENVKLSVDSCYSYLGALKFLSSSFKKTSNKRQNTQNTEEIPKFDMSNSGIYKCLIPGIWIYQEPMSQRRKQLYGDFYVLRVFYPFLNSLWACFEKSAMFCCECWWVSIEERRSLIIPDANYFDKKNSSSCNNYFHFITLSPSLRWDLGKKILFRFYFIHFCSICSFIK